MRYGGYVLFAIPIFLAISAIIDQYKISKRIIGYISVFFIIFALLSFNIRNISRIISENKKYDYNFFSSPFFFVDKVVSTKVAENEKYIIYNPNNKMCWASKTPCSYSKDLAVKNFFWMNMVYRNDQ